MGLRDISASLPPGFRFYPSDEELVLHYLYKKITNEQVLKGTLIEIDLHICEPWQLPEVAKLNAKEWYFFSFRDRKYATGFRTNRATSSGYWKATGKDRTVLDPMTQEVVGMRKTLVFYRNRAPNGIKTGWIMHEFRLETPHMPPKEDWVLCRVFHKSKEEDNKGMSMYENETIIPTAVASSAPPPAQTQTPSLTITSSSPQTNQTIPSIGYNRLDSFSFSMTSLHHHFNPNQNNINNVSNYPMINLLDHYSPEYSNNPTNNNSTLTQISSKCGDDHDHNNNDQGYGFLWNMDFEENTSLEDGVASNMDGLRFEIDNNNNNNNMLLL